MQTRIPSPHALFRNRFTRPAAEEALASAKTTLTSAKTTAQALLQDGVRLARRPQPRTLGIAAASVAATAGIVAGVTVGTASPAAAVNTHDTVAAVSTTHHAAAAPSAAGHAAVTHAAGTHETATHQAATTHSAASHGATPRHVSHASPSKPYSIYDSVTPSSIPSGKQVATYATGPYAQHGTHGKVMWIDVTGQDYKASALDVEPGDATPATAATWAQHKLSASPDAIAHIYTMRSEWPAVKAAVAQLPHKMQSHVRWWIADPTGTPHLVPGSQATQWYWGKGYDISTASPGF